MLKIAIESVGQVLVYFAACVVVGTLASWPSYRQIEPGQSLIKLSLAHSGQRKVECRRFTSKEIAQLPANKRRPNNCARQRVPIRIQLLVDGKQLFNSVVQPAGLNRDGPARLYEKFLVSAGEHVVEIRMKDTPGSGGFDYETTKRITFAPYQSLAVDFSTDEKEFVFY